MRTNLVKAPAHSNRHLAWNIPTQRKCRIANYQLKNSRNCPSYLKQTHTCPVSILIRSQQLVRQLCIPWEMFDIPEPSSLWHPVLHLLEDLGPVPRPVSLTRWQMSPSWTTVMANHTGCARGNLSSIFHVFVKSYRRQQSSQTRKPTDQETQSKLT